MDNSSRIWWHLASFLQGLSHPFTGHLGTQQRVALLERDLMSVQDLTGCRRTGSLLVNAVV